MINFKIIRWKNFLATGNFFTEVLLDEKKMTLIVGSNGSGKSQLLDAITFALFNKPFRKINKPSLVNSINGKNCVVEIEFNIGKIQFKVIRGIKPAIFEIYQDGVMIDQAAANDDYQELLEKSILKMSYKSFTQIVILGSATFTPFMRLNAADRREVLDDLLDVQIFSSMNVLIKQKISDNKTQIIINNQNIENEKKKIDFINKQIEDLKKNSKLYKDNLLSDFENIFDNNRTYRSKHKELEEQLADLYDKVINDDKINKKIIQMTKLYNQILVNKKNISEKLNFFNSHDHCDTCLQPIDQTFRDNFIVDKKQEKKNIEAGLLDLVNKLNTLREEMKILDGYKKSIIEKESQKKVLEAKIKDTQNLMVQRESEINAISVSDGTIALIKKNGLELDESEMFLRSFVAKKQELADEREIFDLGLKILKDGGIKTQIVRQYLPIINKMVNYYLNAMDFMVNFQLDENFDETIMSRFRDEFSYANFSEGEKARIDLSLMLTWRHIANLRNSVNTNLLILDEVFDGSLDSAGSDELVGILKELIKNSNVFVISHREGMRDRFDQTFIVKKDRNFSVFQK